MLGFDDIENISDCSIGYPVGVIIGVGVHWQPIATIIAVIENTVTSIVNKKIVILAQGFPVEFVRVDDWKGNKPKRTIQTWAFSECGVHLNDHEADAFIMALQWRSKVRYMNSVRRARGKKKPEEGKK